MELCLQTPALSAISIVGSLLNGRLGVTFGPSALPNAFNITAFGLNVIASAPSLRVKSGSSARLTVGNETPVLGAVAFQQGGTSVQSVDYRSSGVILDLKPQVRDEGIELAVFQQLSSFAPTSVWPSAQIARHRILKLLDVVSADDLRADERAQGTNFIGSKNSAFDWVASLPRVID